MPKDNKLEDIDPDDIDSILPEDDEVEEELLERIASEVEIPEEDHDFKVVLDEDEESGDEEAEELSGLKLPEEEEEDF